MTHDTERGLREEWSKECDGNASNKIADWWLEKMKSERTALREKVESMKRVIPSRHDRGNSKLNIIVLEEIRTAEGYNQALSEVLDLLNQ